MGKLSTHVLDISIGKPAEGVQIELSIREVDRYRLLRSVVTNSDGRTDEPLLNADTIRAGDYELLFHIGKYFSDSKVIESTQPFLKRVPIHFTISDPGENFHIPLVATPWSYSTYRGS